MLELIASPAQAKFGQDKHDTLTQYCRDCDIRFACHGGCPKDRFATSPNGEPGQHYLCPGYKDFFHHVREPMQQMAAMLRAGGAPADLMTRYAKQDARRGRNDPCTCGNAANGSTATAPDRPDEGDGTGMADQIVTRPTGRPSSLERWFPIGAWLPKYDWGSSFAPDLKLHPSPVRDQAIRRCHLLERMSRGSGLKDKQRVATGPPARGGPADLRSRQTVTVGWILADAC